MAYTKNRTVRESYTHFNQSLSGNPAVLGNLSTTSSIVSYDQTKTGDYLPKWKTIITNGGDATTSFDGVRKFGESLPAACKINYWWPAGQARTLQEVNYHRRWGEYHQPSVSTFYGANMTLANNQALSRLYRDIRANTSHFSGGVFLGELREAMRMIRRPALLLRQGLGDYFSTLRKRKGRAPKHRMKDILSSTWLEYSFGWQPLISDVKAAAEALARFENDSRRASARGYGINERLNQSTVSSNSYGGFMYGLDNLQEISDAKVIYRVGLKWDAAAPFGSARRLAELSGFTLSEFVPTVWELIPWSFVVDYFSNVGDILSCATTDTTSVSYKCKTEVQSARRKMRAIVDSKRVADAIGPREFISIDGSSLGGYNSVQSTVSRRKVSSLGIPTLTFTAPGIDSVKWINLAALTSASRSLTPYRK